MKRKILFIISMIIVEVLLYILCEIGMIVDIAVSVVGLLLIIAMT